MFRSTGNIAINVDKYFRSVFDSSNAVLGIAFTHTPPRKGDSVLYGRDELCTV
jgi:hypothetical protein